MPPDEARAHVERMAAYMEQVEQERHARGQWSKLPHDEAVEEVRRFKQRMKQTGRTTLAHTFLRRLQSLAPTHANGSVTIIRRAESSGKPRASACRSSARSGDSGGDDPPPEQPLARLARRPLQPRRELLRDLAERKRGLDALGHDQQLTLEDVA